MANFLINNLFRFAVSTLNFVSPSIVADILLHPFDFATVLLQIGYNPEGVKYETATLVSVIVQYALFTFYIPYLITSMQGLQFMGMPHPSIFYYVNYIYNKEGLRGCYRGLMPKICERMIMVGVNERVKQRINIDSIGPAADDDDARSNSSYDKFLQTLMNNVCSHFFAVLASHPFHVLMVSSFAEFTYNKKSSIVELTHSIYNDDGYFGFFTGLSARLLGEILSLIFSLTYTNIINKQLSPQQPIADSTGRTAAPTATHLVNYVTNVSRFTVFKQPKSGEEENVENEEDEDLEYRARTSGFQQNNFCFFNLSRNLFHFSARENERARDARHRRLLSLLAYLPITSKLFYYIMIRDFLSKKISSPFFMVCHRSIVLDTGWDKFPLLIYIQELVDFLQNKIIPSRRNRLPKCKSLSNLSL